MFELPAQSRVLSVGHEPNARGNGYVAMDRRRTYLFVGTSLRSIAAAIEDYCHEAVGRTAMFDCASCAASSRGYAGSFRFIRCARSELPALIEQHRARYQRVIVCSSLRSAWTLADLPEGNSAEMDNQDAEFFMEIES
jgi:hypothetical protein